MTHEKHQHEVDPDIAYARGALRAMVSTSLVSAVTDVLGVTLDVSQLEQLAGPANRNLVVALELLDDLARIQTLETIRERFVGRDDHRELVLVRGGRINCIRGDAHAHVPHTVIEHASRPQGDSRQQVTLRMYESPETDDPSPASDLTN